MISSSPKVRPFFSRLAPNPTLMSPDELTDMHRSQARRVVHGAADHQPRRRDGHLQHPVADHQEHEQRRRDAAVLGARRGHDLW